MNAYQLLPKLICLTLTVDNEAEYWEDRLEFIGTEQARLNANKMEDCLLNNNC
jgi:hypothetical protein